VSAVPLAVRLGELAATGYDELPEQIRTSAVDRVVDSVGVSLGAVPLPTSAAAVDLVRARGGTPQAGLLGFGDRLPASAAAFGNGVLAHSLDFDDTHLPSIVHPSASVVPAALAAAQHHGRSGAEFLAAVALGLEACVRVGMAGYDPATGRNTFFDRGQHATSICGAVGAAVAAARLAGAGPDGITHAIGLAASMASGVIEANRTGGTVKRIHCGWAAQSGVTAAELVGLGFTGPPTVLEGRFGLFTAFLGEHAQPDAVVAGLGETWEVPRIFVKPYPANHFTHTIVDAAAALARAGLRPDEVAEVEVGVPSAIVRTVGEPIEVKRAPETTYEAQFSAPYAVSVGLFGGRGIGAELADYDEELARDPSRRALMATVRVVADARCDEVYPHQFPAVVRVVTIDGRHLEERVLANLGSPERPLTVDQLGRKFVGNATRVLTEDRALDLLWRIRALPTEPDVDGVLRAAVPT
jgi:2-methylcitrate dehydratase PrpD